jgi:hypothetical protein
MKAATTLPASSDTSHSSSHSWQEGSHANRKKNRNAVPIRSDEVTVKKVKWKMVRGLGE